MVVLLSMVSLKCISDDYLANPFQQKISRWTTILSLVTGIYAVASVLLTIGLIRQDIIMFQMDRSSLGPFVNCQLMVVFFINLICFAIECIRVGLARQDAHAGTYMIVCNLFLTMIYSELLHRLTSIQEFFSIFVLDTVVLAVEMIAFFVLTLLVMHVLHQSAMKQVG